MREQVLIPGSPRLEGLWDQPDGPEPVGVLVVAHPHPLHGGTMLQPVVYHLSRALVERGYATLRFNFRGVGDSEGSYDGLDERRDVEAAVEFARARVGARVPLALAGYSFGSMMAALAVGGGLAVDALALVAFVVDAEEFMPTFYTSLSSYAGPLLAVVGERDDMAPPARVEGFLTGLGLHPQVVVIPGADHFFVGRHSEVGAAVGDFLDEVLRRPAPSGSPA